MVCPVDLYEHISNAVDTIRTALQQYKSAILSLWCIVVTTELEITLATLFGHDLTCPNKLILSGYV